MTQAVEQTRQTGRTHRMIGEAVEAAETGASVIIVAANEAAAKDIDLRVLHCIKEENDERTEGMMDEDGVQLLWERIIVVSIKDVHDRRTGGLYDRFFVDHAAEEARQREWESALDATLRIGRPT